MKIFVVIALVGEEMENVFVSSDEERALSLQPGDFENCDALFVEVWEEGSKIDDYRLV